MSLWSTLVTLFPPPSFVSPPAGGIDISGGSVKCLLFKDRGDHAEVKTFGESPLPDGVVVGGDIEKPEAVVEILRSFRLRYGIREAHACLPEKKAYLYQVIVPKDAPDLRKGVEFSFETHVPLPFKEAVFDYEPVRRTEEGTVVSVTAFAKRIVDNYRTTFQKAGIVLRSLEVESQALARAIISPFDRKRVVMTIDFGRRTTRIAVVEYGVVSFTATVDIGGETLTTAVMKHLNVPEQEAEQIKNERGFLMNKENKNLVEALMITVSVVKDEVIKHLAYWNSPPADEIPRSPIAKIILCGGNANLRGFAEYLGGVTGVPVEVANVWTNACSLDDYIPPIPHFESLEYATATGLALRGRTTAPW